MTQRFATILLGLAAVAAVQIPAAAQCPPEWLSGPHQGFPGLNGRVYSVTVYDDGSGPAMYVGGFFALAGDVLARNIAKWDGTRWAAVGGGVDASVKALTVYQGELIAGGSFTTAGGVSASRIARWDGSRWAPLGSGVSDRVDSLAVYAGDLIAGGAFTMGLSH